MNKDIYIPDYKEGQCIVIQNKDVIRVYEKKPIYNQNIKYKDYYPNLNYAYNEGIANFGTYYELPVCRTGTNNIMNRYDINIIFPIILIVIILGLMIINKIISDIIK